MTCPLCGDKGYTTAGEAHVMRECACRRRPAILHQRCACLEVLSIRAEGQPEPWPVVHGGRLHSLLGCRPVTPPA